MTNTQTHMHAVLRKSDGATQTSWIPSNFAEVGRYLKLKENGVWTDGWEVIKTYPAVQLCSELVLERERDFKNHRKATDI